MTTLTLLDKKETARLLRCSSRTLDRLRAEGLLKAAKVRGRVLFREEDLEKLVARSVER